MLKTRTHFQRSLLFNAGNSFYFVNARQKKLAAVSLLQRSFVFPRVRLGVVLDRSSAENKCCRNRRVRALCLSASAGKFREARMAMTQARLRAKRAAPIFRSEKRNLPPPPAPLPPNHPPPRQSPPVLDGARTVSPPVHTSQQTFRIAARSRQRLRAFSEPNRDTSAHL